MRQRSLRFAILRARARGTEARLVASRARACESGHETGQPEVRTERSRPGRPRRFFVLHDHVLHVIDIAPPAARRSGEFRGETQEVPEGELIPELPAFLSGTLSVR